MLKKILLIISFVFLSNNFLYSQSLYWDSTNSEKAVEGITMIAQSIISDSFTPMTHFNKGDISASIVPAYFKVKKAYDDPKITCDDFSGKSFGLGAGYAISSNFMVYLIGSYLEMDGLLKGDIYGSQFGTFDVKTEYSLLNVFAGAGIDIVNKEKLSIPIYLGIGFMQYDTHLKLPQLNATLPFPLSGSYSLDVDIEGKQNLYNATIGFAVSYNFYDWFKATPYYLYTRSLNNAELDANVQQVGPLNYDGTVPLNLNKIQASMFGFSMTFSTSDHWSFSINTGGIISSYAGLSTKGLEMLSVVAAISYNGNFLE